MSTTDVRGRRPQKESASDIGKLFIGGVPWDVDDKEFKNYFEQYGEVSEAVIMKRHNGNPRGFGFITYRESDIATKVSGMDLQLKGRKKIEAKRAVPEAQTKYQGVSQAETKVKKVFVGGLPPSVSSKELHAHFNGFGEVQEAEVMIDKASGRSRGFGFVTFDSEETVEELLMQTHFFHDKQVDVKRAIPKARLSDRHQSSHSQSRNASAGYTHYPNHFSAGGHAPTYFAEHFPMGGFAAYQGFQTDGFHSRPFLSEAGNTHYTPFISSVYSNGGEKQHGGAIENNTGASDITPSVLAASSTSGAEYTRSFQNERYVSTNRDANGNMSVAQGSQYGIAFESSPAFGGGGYGTSPSFFYGSSAHGRSVIAGREGADGPRNSGK